MVPGRKALWIKGVGVMPVEAKEAFKEVIKFALIIGIFSIFFIVIKARIGKFLKGMRK